MKTFLLFILFPFLLYSQVQIGQDIDGEAIGDNSGSSVSLSSDGSIVAIGAIGNDGNGENSGHVRVFENVSGSWVQIGSDIDGETDYDYEGYSVSLSSDGSVLAICHRTYNPVSGENSGHIRVFENQSGNWVQIWIEIGEEPEWDYEYDNFGYSVSLSSDGSVIAFGKAGLDGDNSIQSGHVRVFKNLFGNYVQIGSDINNEAIGNRFGYSVSLSSDGSILAIGAIGPILLTNGPTIQNISGYVSIYQNQSGNWIQIGQDIDGEAIDDRSGYSVSLSSDGSVVAIGAIRNNGNGEYSGHVRIYENQNNSWVQIGQDIDGEARGDRSGYSVSLSSDGSVVAIGAVDNDGNGEDSGHVRVYDLTEALSIEENNIIDFNIYPNPTSNSFTVEIPQDLELKEVAIYNNLGQLVTISTKALVDTRSLLSGIYVVEIITNKGKASKKLIIQ